MEKIIWFVLGALVFWLLFCRNGKAAPAPAAKPTSTPLIEGTTLEPTVVPSPPERPGGCA